MTYLETVAYTINSLMKKNPKCIYLGEDIKSGQRGISDGFIKRYGERRVIDTPIWNLHLQDWLGFSHFKL